jgi:hypothetical protein
MIKSMGWDKKIEKEILVGQNKKKENEIETGNIF